MGVERICSTPEPGSETVRSSIASVPFESILYLCGWLAKTDQFDQSPAGGTQGGPAKANPYSNARNAEISRKYRNKLTYSPGRSILYTIRSLIIKRHSIRYIDNIAVKGVRR